MPKELIEVSSDLAVPKVNRVFEWLFRRYPDWAIAVGGSPFGGASGGIFLKESMAVGLGNAIDSLRTLAEVNRRFRRGELPEAKLTSFDPENPVHCLGLREVAEAGRRGFLD